MARQAFYWDGKARQWVFRGGTGGVVAFVTDGGLVYSAAGSYADLNVGSTVTSNWGNLTNVTTTTGTIKNVNVGSTAVIQRMAVAGVASLTDTNITTGTMTNVNVGTALVAQTVRVAGVGSLADARVQRIIVGVGATLSIITKISGTLPTIAAVGSGATAIATVGGVASSGILVGDFLVLKLYGDPGNNMGVGGYYIPTTNVVNVLIQNTQDAAGSLAGLGVDILKFGL